MAGDADVPDGFRPLSKSSPFLDAIGPFYEKHMPDGVAIGLRIEARHANNRAFAHGGLLFTVADLALGMNLARVADGEHGLTVSMSIDFARPVRSRRMGRSSRRRATGECFSRVCKLLPLGCRLSDNQSQCRI